MRTIPFNTAYKYSAKDFGAQGCYVVGAPDVLAGSRAGELADRLTPLLAQGRRVLLLAKYNGTLPDPPAALDPAQLEFLALLPLQNRIRESAPKTFRFFAKQGVKIKVISGDDPQAVSHVAANTALPGPSTGSMPPRCKVRRRWPRLPKNARSLAASRPSRSASSSMLCRQRATR